MKAQKKASERNTLPNIDWNNEDHVSSLTAHKLRLYLKQHNLRVSGGKTTLVARVLRYLRPGLLNKCWNPKTMTQLVTLSCNLVTQKIQTTQKTMHNQTLQKWATLSTLSLSLSQTLMSNASQYMDSSIFSIKDSSIFTIFVGGGSGGGSS